MPDYRIRNLKEKRPVMIVQAKDKPEAFARGASVLGTLPRPVATEDEYWTIRKHNGKYRDIPFFSNRFFELGMDRIPKLPE